MRLLKNIKRIIFSVTFSLVIVIGVPYDLNAQNSSKKAKHSAFKKSKYKKNHAFKKQHRRATYGVSTRFEKFTSIGMNFNIANYLGDVAPKVSKLSTSLSHSSPGLGFFISHKFHPYYGVRASVNWFRIAGDDIIADPSSESGIHRYSRNLSFRNDIKEVSIGLEMYLLPNRGRVRSRLPLNFFSYLGISIYHHEPMAKAPELDYQKDITGSTPAPSAGKWVKLRPLKTEGKDYKSIGIAIPASVGVQIKIPKTSFDFSAEIGIRYLFTDFIDDVSTDYVDLNELTDLERIMSDRSAELINHDGTERDSRINIFQAESGFYTSSKVYGGYPGTQRGNPDKKDLVFLTQLKLIYNLAVHNRAKSR